jgi:hypothetical protein
MAPIDKPREDENHHMLLLDLELMRVNMMSDDSILGAFSRDSSETPSLNLFPHWLSFSKLAKESYAILFTKDLCFLLPSCLDGSHQGDFITHKISPSKYLRMQTFIPMWHGPDMVCHMMPPMAHKFIDYAKYPWPKPSNGLSFV